MPSPQPPTEEFYCEEIATEEVQSAIKHVKTASTPSPFDQVSYMIFKQCPSLRMALVDLFNYCWAQSEIPSQWKFAAIKLIGKSSAADDPTSPSNFRPIALTSCVGKLFTTILRNRWLSYMTTNGYLDSSIQKAFMKATPGCIEHQSKLAAILAEARKTHKSLAVCWLDLANAYGSVHHSLIQFSVQHYHAPAQFCNILQSLYSGLLGTIISSSWSTPTIPLEVGVYQGDPLSVVIFNTVINTLVDTLQTRPDLGFSVSNSHQVNLLQYADDTCITANSPAACQHLLDMVDSWLQWSGMRAKVPKCHCLALQSSTGKLLDPHLSIQNQTIPFIGSGSIKFLGMTIQVPANQSETKIALKTNLERMLKAVDAAPVTRRQKLRLYKAGICPRLTWLLTIQELPITWVERQLETTATRFVKKWAGLAKSANTALLYLPQRMSGLNLPSLSALYKQLQVSRQCQLLTSADACVRHLAEKHLQNEDSLSRKSFKPAVIVRDALADDPGRNRKALSLAVKRKVKDSEAKQRLSQVQQLPKQGEMIRATSSETASVWAKAVQALPSNTMKFALNAAHDSLPHNVNLHMWKKRDSPTCPLCGERQSLLHVLNNCSVARDLRRYNHRHDAVLREIVNFVKPKLPPATNLTADINEYAFPTHIVPTDLRPDIVWWDDQQKSLMLVELTISYETNFDDAAERKEVRYEELITGARASGYDAELITLEVGSRGVINPAGFKHLRQTLSICSTDMSELLLCTCKRAIEGSYIIWCSRNRIT